MTKRSPERIAIPDLEEKLKGRKKPMIVDVRKPSEIAETGVIPGAVHVPVDDVEARIKEFPKDTEIVFYCGGGGRASRAAQVLADAGYSSLYFCGMRDWKKRGLPTSKL
jgi:rhodanese-related sulfurtransferase